jgi:molecular chaperone DnaK (HSP70)
VGTEGGAAAVECPALARALLPEEVSAAVLQGLWARHLQQVPARAVITVPPHFGSTQRAATGTLSYML